MKKKIVFGLILIVLVVIAVISYEPKGEEVDPLQYFDEFSSNENNLVYESERIDLNEPAKMINDEVYVSYEFVRQYISDTIFYDEADGICSLTDVRNVLRLYPDSDKARLNNEDIDTPYHIYLQDGILYIPASLTLEKFGVEVKQGADKRLFVATDLTKEHVTAKVKGKGYLTAYDQRKATVVDRVAKGEEVIIYETGEKYAKVRGEDGIIGYILLKKLKNEETVTASVEVQQAEAWEASPLGEKVKLVWDSVGSGGSDFTSVRYEGLGKANVISPTWFQFEDESGKLSDYGNAAYVEAAHARGLKVWGLMSHNFQNGSLTAEILSSTEKRQYVIKQLIAKAKAYGLDGINIDIENIQEETRDVWVQFMRELYPQLKREGLVVSVDVYVPSNWSAHYERAKIAEVCDYFMVMAYDQHWSGSEEAGSVAEIPWVETSVQANLEEVPAEKLVLGMPFYTRLWEEVDGTLNSSVYDMDSAADLVSKLQLEPTEDAVSGQDYIEYTKNNSVYKLWLENSNSIQKRINIMKKYNLAGFAAWRLGLESDDIWNILDEVQ